MEKSTELKNKEYNYLLTSKDEQVKILSSEILISKQEKQRLKEQESEIHFLNERIHRLQNVAKQNGENKLGLQQARGLLEINNCPRAQSSLEERVDVAAAISNSSSKILNNSASKNSASEIHSKSQENSKIYKRKGEVSDISNQSTPVINKSLLYSKKNK